MSTSRAYLAKRLKAIGRDDLLAAAERGEVTLHSAALWAGLITQQRVPEGNGSQNVSKRKAWALFRAERQGLGPKLEPRLEPEISPKPASPKFSQDSRDIIARLVEAGRTDLVIAVSERRISPFAAARIAERSAHRRVTPPPSTSPQVETKKSEPVKTEKPEPKPRPPSSLDPRALIA